MLYLVVPRVTMEIPGSVTVSRVSRAYVREVLTVLYSMLTPVMWIPTLKYSSVTVGRDIKVCSYIY